MVNCLSPNPIPCKFLGATFCCDRVVVAAGLSDGLMRLLLLPLASDAMLTTRNGGAILTKKDLRNAG